MNVFLGVSAYTSVTATFHDSVTPQGDSETGFQREAIAENETDVTRQPELGRVSEM